MRISQSRGTLAIIVATLGALAGCSETGRIQGPVGGRASLTIMTSADLASERVDLSLAYVRTSGEHIKIMSESFPVTGNGEQALSLTVDLATCLNDAERLRVEGGRDGCVVEGKLVLLEVGAGAVLDSAVIGPLQLVVGAQSQASADLRATGSVTVTGGSALFIGDSITVQAAVLDRAGSVIASRPVTWASSNPAVVSVNAAGRVVAIGAGTATISATSQGVVGDFALTVALRPVQTVTVAVASSSLIMGATTQASAITLDALGAELTGRTITWSSSNPSVASVSPATGLVTAVSPGTASIVATSEGMTGAAAVTVMVAPVNTVTVTLASSSLMAGSTTQASATTRDASNNVLTGRTITWSSANASVATISPTSGLITAVGAGTSTITATSEGKSGIATVTVTVPPVNTVSVSLSASTVTVGATSQGAAVLRDASNNVLTGRSVSWASSNPAVATVISTTGAIVSHGAGTATISAQSEGKTGSATFTVTAVPVQSVTVSLTQSTIAVGATSQGTATTRDISNNVLTGRVVAWSSSDPAVATVSPTTGLVTAVSPGTATIAATSEGKTGTALITIPGRFVSISTGGGHSCALTPLGKVYCWGANYYGQIGDGSNIDRYVPVPVAGTATFASLNTRGSDHSCALTAAGVAYCWGTNGAGELGDGSNTDRNVPTLMAGGYTFASLSTQYGHSCGLTGGGAAYCWGSNSEGQIGDGTLVSRSAPTLVFGARTFTALGGGLYHSCALTPAGAAYCWGANYYGELGNGTTNGATVPTPVSGALTFTSLSGGPHATHTCALTPSGAAYCWGTNFFGQLGDGTLTDRLVPSLVAGGMSFVSLSVGDDFSCGLTAAGAAYCWGSNSYGQLGDGSTSDRLTPTAVAGGRSFSHVRAGGSHACGLASGAAYCWGSNFGGALGDGTSTDRRVPTLVQ